MADDNAAATLDADSKRLQLEAEKAKLAETIAKSQQATADARAAELKAYLPNVTNTPKGEVTVGDKAGALGVWRAHQLIDAAAQKIVEEAATKRGVTDQILFLIVDDRALLPGEWTARHVRGTLDRLAARLSNLDARLSMAAGDLRQALAQEEGATPPKPDRRRGGEHPPVTAAASPAGTGTLGAAFSLLGLLRTDYAITSVPVVATPSQLATLTAAHLAKKGIAGTADEFTTAAESPCLAQLASVLAERDRAFPSLCELQGAVAQAEAQLAGLRARIAPLEQTWATALADGKDGVAALRATVDQLLSQAVARERAAVPARLLSAQAQQIIADVDAAVTAVLQPPAGGEAPLLTAVRRERLNAAVAEGRITHVLYVHLDAVAAEAVTRRSLLGMSSRMRFVSAEAASWLLLDATTKKIVDGGQVSLADVMTFSLDDGSANFQTDGSWLQSSKLSGRDPFETAARLTVLVLAVLLFAVGVLSVVALIEVVTP